MLCKGPGWESVLHLQTWLVPDLSAETKNIVKNCMTQNLRNISLQNLDYEGKEAFPLPYNNKFCLVQIELRYIIQLLFIESVCHCQTMVVKSNVIIFLSHQTLCGMDNQEQSVNRSLSNQTFSRARNPVGNIPTELSGHGSPRSVDCHNKPTHSEISYIS